MAPRQVSRIAVPALVAVVVTAIAWGATATARGWHHSDRSERAAPVQEARSLGPGDGRAVPASRIEGRDYEPFTPDEATAEIVLEGSLPEYGRIEAVVYRHRGQVCLGFLDEAAFGATCEAANQKWSGEQTFIAGYGKRDMQGTTGAVAWGYAPAGTDYVEFIAQGENAPTRVPAYASSRSLRDRSFYFGEYKAVGRRISVTAYRSDGSVIEHHDFGYDQSPPPVPAPKG